MRTDPASLLLQSIQSNPYWWAIGTLAIVTVINFFLNIRNSKKIKRLQGTITKVSRKVKKVRS